MCFNHGKKRSDTIISATQSKLKIYVVLCHNHPGGVALPSEDDICTTRYLQQLMEGVGIIVLDHVIVAGNQTYSMAQHSELLHPSEIMRAMVAAAEKPLRK